MNWHSHWIVESKSFQSRDKMLLKILSLIWSHLSLTELTVRIPTNSDIWTCTLSGRFRLKRYAVSFKINPNADFLIFKKIAKMENYFIIIHIFKFTKIECFSFSKALRTFKHTVYTSKFGLFRKCILKIKYNAHTNCNITNGNKYWHRWEYWKCVLSTKW